MENIILAADIGGTKTHFGLFSGMAGSLQLLQEATFLSQQYASLEELLQEFLRQTSHRVSAACIGVACPIQDGKVEAPNLPWIIDRRQVEKKSAIPHFHLINDLVANAYGVATLSRADILELNPGEEKAEANRALIAAGTGLGKAILFWNGKQWHPSPSEGGHIDFAPTSEEEMELLRFLLRRYSRVSLERVLSGPGLFLIYQFLREQNPEAEPAWLAQKIQGTDPSAAIAEAGLEKKSELASKALDWFAKIYGQAAGDLALSTMAQAGIYLGGGIAPKIILALQKPAFMQAFTNKGRLSELVSRIPVRVILNPKTALLGAAHCAFHHLSSTFE
jgi:glucokinase